MGSFTLYADIYPSGHKKLVQEFKERVTKGMPKLTGIISQHDTSNGYWSNIQSCATHILVEPPLTRSFYRKDVDDKTGELVVTRKIEPKHMPFTDLWGEIVSESIADALRKPTKGEAIISPVLDTYKTDGLPLSDLLINAYSIKDKGHDRRYEIFNKHIADYVVDTVHKKKADRRPIFAGVFLDSEEIKDAEFLKIIDSYSNLEISGYFLVMQDISYQSKPEKLLALKDFISNLLKKNPERKIILYRTGMLGALYSALFPEAEIGSTYGLPYRDSYNIRNINPVKETRPLKNSKLVYSPVLLTTIKIPDALSTWKEMGIEITPTEAQINFSSMLNMAEKTQGFAHELNKSSDKKFFLKEHLSKGIKFMKEHESFVPSSYGEHLRNWFNLL